MELDEAVISSIRDRTRSALLSAAASTLARNRSATMSDIAERAGVGRSTIHRYFPTREHLIEATVADSAESVETAVAEAKPEQGTPTEALRRLLSALVEVGDRIVFLFDDPAMVERLHQLGYVKRTNDPLVKLIERGQRDGIFDASVSPYWIQNVIWAMVYTGIESSESGTLLRHDIVPTIMRLLTHGIIASEGTE